MKGVENGRTALGNPVAERFDLLPPRALARVARIRAAAAEEHGEEGVQEWVHATTISQHLNKALVHVYAWLSGDRSEDHVGHALCRAMFAAELDALVEEAAGAVLSTGSEDRITLSSPGWTRRTKSMQDAITARLKELYDTSPNAAHAVYEDMMHSMYDAAHGGP